MSNAQATTSGAKATKGVCVHCGGINHVRSNTCAQCGKSPWRKQDVEALELSGAATQQAQDQHPPVDDQTPPPDPVGQPQLLQTIDRPVSKVIPVLEPSYIVDRDFRCQLSGITIELPRGKLLADPWLIDKLLTVQAPISRVDEHEMLVRCPDCGGLFRIGDEDGRGQAH